MWQAKVFKSWTFCWRAHRLYDFTYMCHVHVPQLRMYINKNSCLIWFKPGAEMESSITFCLWQVQFTYLLKTVLLRVSSAWNSWWGISYNFDRITWWDFFASFGESVQKGSRASKASLRNVGPSCISVTIKRRDAPGFWAIFRDRQHIIACHWSFICSFPYSEFIKPLWLLHARMGNGWSPRIITRNARQQIGYGRLRQRERSCWICNFFADLSDKNTIAYSQTVLG